MIQILRKCLKWQFVFLHHQFRVGVHERRICLDMDDALVLQEMAIALHEIGGSQSLGGFLHLWVGKCEPDFNHFVFTKHLMNELNVGAKKTDIVQSFYHSRLCSMPHARAFDINPNKILIGKSAGKSYGVFTSSASQFQHNGVFVLEEILMPSAFQRQALLLELPKRTFHNKRVLSHVGEFCQFTFPHYSMTTVVHP